MHHHTLRLLAAAVALTVSSALPLAAQAADNKGAAAAKPAKADPALVAKAEKLYLDSFDPDQPRTHLDRLKQDEAMALCSQYKDNPPAAVRARIEKAQLETIRFPVEGRLVGDWKKGEELASSGRGGHIGKIQPDPKGTPRGGNCYACHQLATKEVAYGTIGPSLHNFGKVRGYGEDIARYAYMKVYNAQAFSACTNMPRFGYHAWLTPEQIADIVAFLMDPESPVNKD